MKIIPFHEKHQESINSLISEIEEEFENPISKPNPNVRKIVIDKYWLAITENIVIGTIAILRIRNRNAVLKSMFLKKKYRGKEKGISNLLLKTALHWCEEEGISKVFLGTMSQFKRAHQFYEKNGFQEIHQSELTMDFIQNPLDDVFYMKVLPT